MIEKETIETIKTGIDLVALVQSRGIDLKKNGQSYLGLCPFHDDTNPSLSVNPSKNLWQCFGGGAGGDVIRFVELFDKLDFPEALETLQINAPDMGALPKNRKEKPPLPESKVQQLLGRAVTIYEKNFEESGTKHLEQRGITDAGLFTRHRVGFCSGKLKEILPSNGQVREDLRTVGILGDQDTERFSGCIVFPVYDLEGNIVTLYGRFFHPATKRHVFLPNRSKGLWNIAAIKTYPEIILTESVIDALSVETAGYANVISIQGTNSLGDDDIRLFKEYGVQKLILMLDGDEAGQKAQERLKEKINGFFCEVKQLPDGHDPNSYLMEYGAGKLAEFIQSPAIEHKEQSSSQLESSESIRRQADGFVVNYGLRQYQVMGLEKGLRKLKATVRVEYAGKLHVDTLDFYAARSRKMLAQDICRIFDELPETIDADITRLMLACEKTRDEQPASQDADQKPPAERISARDEKEALEFGKSTDLIQHILDDFERCGLIGEEANKLLGYIAMTSRKRSKPLSVLIIASSGAGKTALQDAIVQFCPPEDLVKITNLSGKALFYKDKVSLTHKVLALEEGDGAREAFYAIRSLISAGVLVSETTIKGIYPPAG